MKYFRKLIDDILRYAQNYGQQQSSIRVKLLKILYNLLLIDAVPVKTLISDKLNTASILVDDQLIEEFVDVENDLEESKDESEVFLGYMDDSSQLDLRFRNTEGKGTARPDNQKLSTLVKTVEKE